MWIRFVSSETLSRHGCQRKVKSADCQISVAGHLCGMPSLKRITGADVRNWAILEEWLVLLEKLNN